MKAFDSALSLLFSKLEPFYFDDKLLTKMRSYFNRRM